MDYKSLLYICECPPSTAGGLCVIARQLFTRYDPDKLDVLCCDSKYQASELIRKTHLPCRHTSIPRILPYDFRPRRLFGPLLHSVNSHRTGWVLQAARKIVKERRTEALFVIPGFPEFTVAAYQLHKETGLPLYVFETDDWEATNGAGRPGRMTHAYHRPLLEAAERLWLTSPAMVERYRDRFGVDAEFLFNFVDLDDYLCASSQVDSPADRELTIVYTGAINEMFIDTMRWFCDILNRGLTIAGRRVRMRIYSGTCPAELQGPQVSFEGFVPMGEIPGVLARADVLLIGVSFTQDPRIKEMVMTSMYTKTVDYLASNRPVLVIAPPYTAEVKYFGDVTAVVPSLDEAKMKATLERLTAEAGYRADLCRRGVDLVRHRHSLQSLDGIFLRHFRRDSAESVPPEVRAAVAV